MKSLSFFPGPEHQPLTLGDGPPDAILIHGFVGTPAGMRPLAQILHQSGWIVHVPLLPGSGPDIVNLPQIRLSDWLEAAQDVWNQVPSRTGGEGKPSVLVGYSMGGAIAIHLSVTKPPDYLVLLAPFWRPVDWRAQLLPVIKYFYRSYAPYAKADFSHPSVRSQIHRMLPDVDIDHPTAQTFLRKRLSLPTAVIDEVRRLGKMAYRLAHQVKARTLILQGTSDYVVHHSHTRQLVKRLGGPVVYHEFPGDHHFFKFEGDESYNFANLVLSFLDAGEPDRRQSQLS